MDVLFASELLVPARGGAERTMLEWAHGLRDRGHTTRTVYLPADGRPGPERYWRWRAGQRAQLHDRVAQQIAQRRPDVVVAQLHGAPGALRAAADAGVPGALVFASYESLCKLAFDPGSQCPAGGDCVGCPAARGLTDAERDALRASRVDHDGAVDSAAALFAPSRAVAARACAWCDRHTTVVYPVGPDMPAPVGARRDGPVTCVAANWTRVKGATLLPALVRATLAAGAPQVRVTEAGLTDTQRAELLEVGATLVAPAPIDELLHGCALLLVPSQWDEPFGRVAWEALARGVPVLASAAGGMVEYVPGDLVVAPRDDIAAWETAIRRLVADKSTWSHAARHARGHAQAVLRPVPLDRLEARLRAISPG